MDSSGNNRYELLFLDDDASPALAVPAESVAAKKKTKPVVAKKSLPTEKENKSGLLNKNDGTKKVTVSSTGQSTKNKMVSQKSSQGSKPSSSGEGGRNDVKQQPQSGTARDQRSSTSTTGNNNNNRRNVQSNNNEFGNDRPQRQYRDRNDRGPPRQRNVDRFGKREFDRQSGSDKTGVKAIDKRDGAGAHNWGSAKQDIEDINKNGEGGDAAVLTDKDESTNEQTGDQVVSPDEEETKEMTLDEWKALTGQRAKPKFNLRKAGEGVDNSQWKKMVVLTKKGKEIGSEDELEYDPSLYPQRVGRLQRIVDIEFNFNDGRRGGFRNRNRGPRPPRQSGEEGGRGNAGGTGGGNRYAGSGGVVEGGRFSSDSGGRFDRGARNYGERPQRSGGNALKVDDERQFPTLG